MIIVCITEGEQKVHAAYQDYNLVTPLTIAKIMEAEGFPDPEKIAEQFSYESGERSASGSYENKQFCCMSVEEFYFQRGQQDYEAGVEENYLYLDDPLAGMTIPHMNWDRGFQSKQKYGFTEEFKVNHLAS